MYFCLRRQHAAGLQAAFLLLLLSQVQKVQKVQKLTNNLKKLYSTGLLRNIFETFGSLTQAASEAV